VILRANRKILQEAFMMSESVPTLEEIMGEIGLAAKWEARGREEGQREIAMNALLEGASVDFVQEITGLDTETIRSLGANPV
jgi:hypothetical protein